MSVLVFCGLTENLHTKPVLESITVGSELARNKNAKLYALTCHTADTSDLKRYGVDYIIKVPIKQPMDPSSTSELIHQVLVNTSEDIDIIILAKDENTKTIGGGLSGKLHVPYIGNVNRLENGTPLRVRRTIFSGKALETLEINSGTCILSLIENTFEIKEQIGKGKETHIDFQPSEQGIKMLHEIKNPSKVSLGNASIVVSGGRGLKGPENWYLLEDLASILNGALACSRTVSDEEWRPHEEHVGQTGKHISPNLYIAVGISGAIQHLAGVNSSKIKVVINTDPEAPFFKAADYGIVGDAFEIIPKLTSLLKSKITSA